MYSAITKILVSSFDSSVGRAVDCSGIKLSIGRWFESGSKDELFFLSFSFFFPSHLNSFFFPSHFFLSNTFFIAFSGH